MLHPFLCFAFLGEATGVFQKINIMKPRYIFYLFLLLTTSSIAQTTHSWQRTNPGGGGSFATVGAGPTGQIIVGSDLGGAYYSWDKGQTWEVYGATKGLTNTHVSAVGFHPTNGSIFYLGTDAGIYRSGNGGSSLSQVLANGYITDIQIASVNPNIGYAAYHPTYDSPNGEVWKTTNNGLTWSKVSTNLPSGLRLLKIVVAPTDANVLYALSGSGRFACTVAEVYKSTNGGQSWTSVSTSLAPVLDIAIHPNNANILYASTMNADCANEYYWDGLAGNFYESTNAGQSWTPKANQTGWIWIKKDAPTTIRMIDPRESFPWNPDAGTWESTNSGQDWTKVATIDSWNTGYIDSHFWSYGPAFDGITKTLGADLSNPNHLFWVNSQYVYGTFDGGRTFQPLHTQTVTENTWQSRGIDNVVMFDLEINEANPDILYAGMWDMGLWRSLNGGQSWESCNHPDYSGRWDGNGGNTSTVISDPMRSNVVWANLQGDSDQSAHLVKSTQNGDKDSWQLSNSGLPTTNALYGLSLDTNSPTNQRKLFVTASGNVYRSTNDGNNWSSVLTNGGLRFTAVDRFNPNLVYAGGENGFWRSTNGGTTWQEMGLTAMRGTISGTIREWGWEGVFNIHVDNHQTGWVYVAATGAGKGLFRSKDGGVNWEKLITDDYMRAVAVSPQDGNKIYAGSSSAHFAGGYNSNSKGILYSEDGGNTWTDINGATPFPFALTIDITSDKVFVGSPGSGFQYAAIGENGEACSKNALTLNQSSINSGDYATTKSITSSGTIPSGQAVNFYAEQTITLLPNFHAQSGSTFSAKIQSCTPYLLQNAGFEEGIKNWITNTCCGATANFNEVSGDAYEGNESVCVDATQVIADRHWYIQLVQENIDIVQGQTYQLTFAAKATQNGFQMGTSFYEPSITTVLDGQLFTLTQDWATYTFTYQATKNTTMELVFDLGFQVGNICLDNVQLVVIENNNLISRKKLNTRITRTNDNLTKNEHPISKIFPNPASQEVTIAYVLPKESSLLIQLMDLNGRVLQRFSKVNNEKGETNQLPINISNLPTGLYYISLTSNETKETHKVLIGR